MTVALNFMRGATLCLRGVMKFDILPAFAHSVFLRQSMETQTQTAKPRPALEQKIIQTILHRSKPRRIILFGSRARGDADERSDYDIAIDDEHLTRAALAHIRADLEELRTLLNIDLVWMKQATPVLRQRILSEGKILYDQKN